MASCDLGDLGPKDGKPVSYYWNPLYNVLGALPWLLLVLTFILLKENRTPQAFWILMPIVLWRLAWMLFASLMHIPSQAGAIFVSLIDCLLIALAINGLLAQRIGNRNRFATWLLGWGVFAVVYGAVVVNLGFGSDTVQASIIMGITAAALMIGFALAGLLCRRKWRPVRFSLWLVLWLWVLSAVSFLSVMLVVAAINNFSIAGELLQVLIVSLVFTAIMAIGLLPFEILFFKNSFWRKRFEALFGIKTPEKEEVIEPEIPACE